jgi:Leucine-rich repeat (LRR) protein
MKLFLSYNSKNRLFVEWMASNLSQSGFTVFFDQESIKAGDVFTDVIQKGIVSSDAALVFIGEEGIGNWQNMEILKIVNGATQNKDYRIVPVILSGSNKSFTHNLPWFLAGYQWVQFKDTGDTHAFTKLLEGLRSGEQETDLATAGKNPYKGLKSFDVADDYIFYGRTFDLNLVFHQKLRLHISVENNNFLAIVADSGTGKSSFAKAGILAALKKGGVAGSENWRQLIVKPGHSPLTALSAGLVQEKLIPGSRAFEEAALQHDDELLRTIRDQKDTWVIYIDQFEEVISQCKQEPERVAFLNNIARVIECERVVILLSLRSDFYTAFAPYTLFKGILENNNYTLSVIDVVETDNASPNRVLRDIISKPAKNAGVQVDSQLEDTLVTEIKKVKGPLPILQLTLDLLWENRKKDTKKIDLDDFAAIGQSRNIAGVIQAHADKVYNNITNGGSDKRKTDLFKKIFVPHLIEVGAGGEDVRRTALKKELLQIKGYEEAETETMLQALSSENARLLTVSGTGGEAKVEVVHEVIIREWPLLKKWIDERRAALLFRTKLNGQVNDWKNKEAGLYKGRNLRKAKAWAKSNPDLSNETTDAFIHKSANKAKLNTTLLVAIPLLLLVLFYFLYPVYQRRQVIREIAKFPSIQVLVEEEGGDLDSVKELTVDAQNYLFLKDKIGYFRKLQSVTIAVGSNVDLSFLGRLNSIKSLIISGNTGLQNLQGLENITSLQFLKINYNPDLTSIKGIEKLNSLDSLEIILNHNLIDLKGIEQLKSLHSLEISNNYGLTNLHGIEQLKTLHSLKISGNNGLTNLQGIEELKSLHSLEISNNDSLTNLQGIGQLDSLHSLTIYMNVNLKNLNGIEGLKSLHSLKISGNQSLTNLQGIGQLDSLHSLTIYNFDSLTNLQGIEQFKLLHSLTISGNENLKDLQGLGQLQSLHSLEISDNDGLTNLQGIGQLDSLHSLTISYNGNLTNLQGIEQFKLLHSLTISGNENLKDLQGIEQLKSLDSLTISSNLSLKNLQGIEELKSLHSLEISRNDSLTNLQGIGQLDSLHSLTIYMNGNLKNLQGIEQLKSLHSLTISGNHSLTNLPDIVQLKSLDSLTISYNGNLKNLQGIEQLKSLDFLTISGNDYLENLQGLGQLKSLVSLTISDNDGLTNLQGIEQLKSLVALTISENRNLKNLQGIEQLKSLTSLVIKSGQGFFEITNIYACKNLKEISVTRNIKIDNNKLRNKNPGVKIKIIY